MSGLTVRRATAADADALALVGSATFLETYALSLPGRNIVAHCAKAHAPQVYAAWLADLNYALWVAEVGDGTVVGYAVLAPPDLPEAQTSDLELRRIYLVGRFRGGGIGRQLIASVAEEAKRRGANRLTLGIYGENEAALAFYTHLGFVQIGTREFTVGDKVCQDFVLGLSL